MLCEQETSVCLINDNAANKYVIAIRATNAHRKSHLDITKVVFVSF